MDASVGALRFTDPQVILFSDNPERASEFYRKLGFVEAFRTPRTGAPIHVDLILDGYKIGFSSIDSSRHDHGLNPATAGQRATVTLWTTDVHASLDAVLALGAVLLADPAPWLDRLLIAWVADPDGNPIQLIQSIAG